MKILSLFGVGAGTKLLYIDYPVFLMLQWFVSRGGSKIPLDTSCDW